MSIRNDQIRALRDEALQHGDVAMAVICETATGEETIGDELYSTIAPETQRELETMTRVQALERVAAAMNAAAAMRDD